MHSEVLAVHPPKTQQDDAVHSTARSMILSKSFPYDSSWENQKKLAINLTSQFED